MVEILPGQWQWGAWGGMGTVGWRCQLLAKYSRWRWKPSHAVKKCRATCLISSRELKLSPSSSPGPYISRPYGNVLAWDEGANFWLNTAVKKCRATCLYNAYTHKLFWFWVARVFGSYRRGLCAPWQVSPPKSKKASALIVRSLVLGSRQAATSDKGHVVTTQSSAKILEFWTSNHHFEVDETFQILFPFISGAEGTAFATEWSTQESLTPAVSLESDKAFSPRAPGWEQSGKMWENCAKLAGKISDFLSPLFMTWFAHEPLRLRRSALLQWAWRASSVWQEDNLNSCRKLHLFFFWSLWCNRGLVARLPLLFLRLSRCDPSVSQCVYKEIVAHFFVNSILIQTQPAVGASGRSQMMWRLEQWVVCTGMPHS